MAASHWKDLENEFRAGLDGVKFVEYAGTARLGDGDDAGNVPVPAAQRQYPTFPLFWVYREGNTSNEVFQAVPWYPGLTYDNSQRHMEVFLVRFPQLDPKLHWIWGFTDIGLAAWNGVTPLQAGLANAAIVTPDKVFMHAIYPAGGLVVGYRGGVVRKRNRRYYIPANAALLDVSTPTDYRPSASNLRWIRLHVNTSGVVSVTQGSEFADSDPSPRNYEPTTVADGSLDLGAVLLSNGMTDLEATWGSIAIPAPDMFTIPEIAETASPITELDNTSLITILDNNLTIQDNVDNTKQAQFQLSSLTTATTRTFTLPDVSDTFVMLAATQTLTNKTLTSPTINTPVISGGTINNNIIGGTTPAAGTFTALTITNTSATSQLTINADAGQSRSIEWQSAGSRRWFLDLTESETGSDAGSNWRLTRLTDAGASSTAMRIIRSSGNFELNGAVTTTFTDTGTNNLASVLTLRHNTSGTPTTNFGLTMTWQAHTPGTPNTVRDQVRLSSRWVVATDASRTARGIFEVADSGGFREAIRFEANGSAALVGLVPTTVTQPTLGSEVFRLTSTATNDDPAEIVYQNRVATTNATVTTLHTFTVPASTTYTIEAVVTARRTGGASGTAEDGAGYKLLATYNNIAGTATIIGAITVIHTAENQAGWNATFTVSGATVLCEVTGAASNNVSWHMTARVHQVSS